MDDPNTLVSKVKESSGGCRSRHFIPRSRSVPLVMAGGGIEKASSITSSLTPASGNKRSSTSMMRLSSSKEGEGDGVLSTLESHSTSVLSDHRTIKFATIDRPRYGPTGGKVNRHPEIPKAPLSLEEQEIAMVEHKKKLVAHSAAPKLDFTEHRKMMHRRKNEKMLLEASLRKIEVVEKQPKVADPNRVPSPNGIFGVGGRRGTLGRGGAFHHHHRGGGGGGVMDGAFGEENPFSDDQAIETELQTALEKQTHSFLTETSDRTAETRKLSDGSPQLFAPNPLSVGDDGDDGDQVFTALSPPSSSIARRNSASGTLGLPSRADIIVEKTLSPAKEDKYAEIRGPSLKTKIQQQLYHSAVLLGDAVESEAEIRRKEEEEARKKKQAEILELESRRPVMKMARELHQIAPTHSKTLEEIAELYISLTRQRRLEEAHELENYFLMCDLRKTAFNQAEIRFEDYVLIVRAYAKYAIGGYLKVLQMPKGGYPFSEKVLDGPVARRLDRTHSGNLELVDVVHFLYPNLSMSEIEDALEKHEALYHRLLSRGLTLPCIDRLTFEQINEYARVFEFADPAGTGKMYLPAFINLAPDAKEESGKMEYIHKMFQENCRYEDAVRTVAEKTNGIDYEGVATSLSARGVKFQRVPYRPPLEGRNTHQAGEHLMSGATAAGVGGGKTPSKWRLASQRLSSVTTTTKRTAPPGTKGTKKMGTMTGSVSPTSQGTETPIAPAALGPLGATTRKISMMSNTTGGIEATPNASTSMRRSRAERSLLATNADPHEHSSLVEHLIAPGMLPPQSIDGGRKDSLLFRAGGGATPSSMGLQTPQEQVLKITAAEGVGTPQQGGSTKKLLEQKRQLLQQQRTPSVLEPPALAGAGGGQRQLSVASLNNAILIESPSHSSSTKVLNIEGDRNEKINKLDNGRRRPTPMNPHNLMTAGALGVNSTNNSGLLTPMMSLSTNPPPLSGTSSLRAPNDQQQFASSATSSVAGDYRHEGERGDSEERSVSVDGGTPVLLGTHLFDHQGGVGNLSSRRISSQSTPGKQTTDPEILDLGFLDFESFIAAVHVFPRVENNKLLQQATASSAGHHVDSSALQNVKSGLIPQMPELKVESFDFEKKKRNHMKMGFFYRRDSASDCYKSAKQIKDDRLFEEVLTSYHQSPPRETSNPQLADRLALVPTFKSSKSGHDRTTAGDPSLFTEKKVI